MATESPFERAERIGLSRKEVHILYCVAAWFSGKIFEVESRRSIATHHEPTLRQLCAAADLWGDGYDQVLQGMIDRGLFKTESRNENIYIAGRRCDWLPTQNCMKIIESVFRYEDNLYPNWATEDHSRPPTFRDGNELMPHRKGVYVAAKSFMRYNGVDGLSVDYYPRVNVPERPDLRVYGNRDVPLAKVEMLTNHGDRESWERKFDAWSSPKDWTTFWVHENRAGMIQFWNHLVRHGLIELDGGLFSQPAEKWPPVRVNDRLKRSRTGRMDYSSNDFSWTLPGLLQADVVDLHEWVKKYNII